MDSNNEQEKQTIFKEEMNDSAGAGESTASQPTSLGMEQNIAGLLCYLVGVISGLIIFLIEKKNKFVRFHAMQSILVFVVVFVLSIVLSFIPLIGWILSLLLAPASFVLWIFLMFKAYQNEWFKLPYIGDIAENQVNK